MRGRLIVRISPEDVGERVSVRRRLPSEGDDEPEQTEVLGHLVAWQDGEVAIERGDGEVVRFPEADLLAGRRVPPPPPPRR